MTDRGDIVPDFSEGLSVFWAAGVFSVEAGGFGSLSTLSFFTQQGSSGFCVLIVGNPLGLVVVRSQQVRSASGPVMLLASGGWRVQVDNVPLARLA